jgi:hypothetical protein
VPTVDLRSTRDLQRVLAACVVEIERRTIKSMHEAVRWGLATAVRDTKREGATATNTFAQAWFARTSNDGAMLGNSAAHAVFVERGRKPGKQPPVSVIEDWIEAKKLVSNKPAKPPRESRRIRGPTGNISGAKQRSRLQGIHRKLRITAMALAIARKIGRKGTKGRWILRDLVPRMYSKFKREVRSRLRQLTANPPR